MLFRPTRCLTTRDEAWASMPEAATDFLASLKEFDSEIFFEITGIRKGETCRYFKKGIANE